MNRIFFQRGPGLGDLALVLNGREITGVQGLTVAVGPRGTVVQIEIIVDEIEAEVDATTTIIVTPPAKAESSNSNEETLN